VTAHLHSAVQPGSGTVAVSIPAAGRTVTSATAVLEQGARRAATAAVVLAGPGDSAPTAWPGGRRDMSGLPAPDELERLSAFDDGMPFARHVDIRPVGDSRPFGSGEDPVLTAWIRLGSSTPYGPAVACILLDALAPSLYAVLTDPVAIPTVEFTVHLSPVRPAGEWFLVEQRTTWSTASFCVDDAGLYAPDGTAVAQSRQLRRVLGP
jgi:acyl-CoA thioesterase